MLLLIAVNPQIWWLAVGCLVMVNQIQSRLEIAKGQLPLIWTMMKAIMFEKKKKKRTSGNELGSVTLKAALIAGDRKFLTNYAHLRYKTVGLPVAHLGFFNVLATTHIVKWTVCGWFGKTEEDRLRFISQTTVGEVTKTQGTHRTHSWRKDQGMNSRLDIYIETEVITK